jgi:hypothetical protein
MIEQSGGGSRIALSFVNLPKGLRPEDNDVGVQISLEQLAKIALKKWGRSAHLSQDF